MMAREEAIRYYDYINRTEDYGSKQAMAARIALSALRPVSREQELEAENKELKERIVNWRKYMAPTREQVEKVWRGEWMPAESDFDDDDTLFDVEDWCDWQCSACHNEVCYDDPMERRWLPKFCPNCGAPMTDEAVEMEMDRLEALYEAD